MTRRRSSAASQRTRRIVEGVRVANRFSWWKALLLGVVGFLLFALLLPYWVDARLQTVPNSGNRQQLADLLGRRYLWLQGIGMACLIVGMVYALCAYWIERAVADRGRQFFATLMPRKRKRRRR